METRGSLAGAVERGGQPQDGKNFELLPPPVVSFVRKGKVAVQLMQCIAPAIIVLFSSCLAPPKTES